MLCAFILILATNYGDFLITSFARFINCPTNSENLSMCLGISLIVRVALALFILHFLIAIFLFTRDGFARFINEECFALKAIIVFVIVFLLMFIDNDYLLIVV